MGLSGAWVRARIVSPTPAQKKAGQRIRLNTLALAVVDARRKRDTLIAEMSADGWSLREIADAAGLSHSAIAKIVRRDG